jgi:hypothetical protein
MHNVLDKVYIHCIVTCSARHHFYDMVTNSLWYHLPYVMPLAVGVYGNRTFPLALFCLIGWLEVAVY